MLDIEISHMDTEWKDKITAEEVADYFIKHLENNPIIWRKKGDSFEWDFHIDRDVDFHYASLLNVSFDSYERASHFWWWLLDRGITKKDREDFYKCRELFREWIKELFEEEGLN